jgi:hypothetical protein
MSADSERLQLQIAHLLIEHGANINQEPTTSQNMMPLASAVRWNNYPLVKLLLEEGANPNKLVYYKRKFTFTILESAFFRQRSPYRIAELLLKHGADPTKVRFGTKQGILDLPHKDELPEHVQGLIDNYTQGPVDFTQSNPFVLVRFYRAYRGSG